MAINTWAWTESIQALSSTESTSCSNSSNTVSHLTQLDWFRLVWDVRRRAFAIVFHSLQIHTDRGRESEKWVITAKRILFSPLFMHFSVETSEILLYLSIILLFGSLVLVIIVITSHVFTWYINDTIILYVQIEHFVPVGYKVNANCLCVYVLCARTTRYNATK